MKYTIIIQVETSRKMEGSDEFLLCTAQRAGLKRRPAKVTVLQQAVTPGHCNVLVGVPSKVADMHKRMMSDMHERKKPPAKGLVAQVIKRSPKLAAAYKRLLRDKVKRSAKESPKLAAGIKRLLDDYANRTKS